MNTNICLKGLAKNLSMKIYYFIVLAVIIETIVYTGYKINGRWLDLDFWQSYRYSHISKILRSTCTYLAYETKRSTETT